MPNHVHVLLTPHAHPAGFDKTLASITQTLKRHTARQINKLLNREGSLWASESYDHVIRNDSEFSRIVSYILLNPVKANLAKNWQDWKYSWVAEALADIMG